LTFSLYFSTLASATPNTRKYIEQCYQPTNKENHVQSTTKT
jgi:hypothetical protein